MNKKNELMMVRFFLQKKCRVVGSGGLWGFLMGGTKLATSSKIMYAQFL